MPTIHIPPRWAIPERLVTPESVYRDRRAFLRTMGLAVPGLWLAGCVGGGSGREGAAGEIPADAADATWSRKDYAGAPALGRYPLPRNPAFVSERPLTEEARADRYCNFYEFTSNKDVFRYVRDYRPYPWTIEVAGLCAEPRIWNLEDVLQRFPLEERVYRHRCVEAWSMVVPWTGFPLRLLLQAAGPKPEARFVRFTCVHRPEELPGQESQHWYKWPYYEGARIDEAMHELAFFTTGIYGHPLSKPHGAPCRIVFPWKYGYKGPKAVVKIEFTAAQPQTFWNDLQPAEYGFYSNVDPSRPHPRWSQSTERVLDTGERIPTQYLNGYAPQVAALYGDSDLF